MKLHLTRPLAIFDLEATGLNISKERIVEMGVLQMRASGGGGSSGRHWGGR